MVYMEGDELYVSIEEGFKQKPRQRLSRLFGGQIFVNSLPRNYFASVDLEELD